METNTNPLATPLPLSPADDTICAAIEDLLPLYIDSALSAQTRGWVEKHISHCPHCAALLADAQRPVVLTPDTDISPLRALEQRLKIHRLAAALLSAAAVVVIVWGLALARSITGSIPAPQRGLADLMQNITPVMDSYLFALAIVAANVLRAWLDCRESAKSGAGGLLGIVSTVFSGLVMASGWFLSGILADNDAPGIYGWFGFINWVSVAGLALFIVQLVLFAKGRPRQGDTNLK